MSAISVVLRINEAIQILVECIQDEIHHNRAAVLSYVRGKPNDSALLKKEAGSCCGWNSGKRQTSRMVEMSPSSFISASL
ncbi:MAG: hypothetical protein M2R45_02985 [Verrucomicrobia subdivision 3 bacterium]|nr:hypothetical protein [Limisphaerales bacterium]MCS1416529.1 hypothetical protein [Limisphaerales bacterium]